jgi:hypothetical protein
MISIENANLETALADLMGAVLAIREDVARAIFFAPRAAILRIEILEAATKARLRPIEESSDKNEPRKAEALKKMRNLLRKAKAIVGKRHGIIYDTWGIETETGQVMRAKVSDHLRGKPAPISDLDGLITQYRLAIMDAQDLRREFRERPPMPVDMRRE